MKRSRTAHLDVWRKSPAWRAIAREQCRRMNKAHRQKPRCGARAKSTGQPCQNHALQGRSRCRFHGGITGRQDKWHQPVWPNGDAPNAEEKLRCKLNDQERTAKKRAARLAAMSPRQREQHEAWQRTHRPGDPAERERLRQDRKQAKQFRAALEQPPRPPNAEAAAVRERIEALEAEHNRLQAQITKTDEGVFG